MSRRDKNAVDLRFGPGDRAGWTPAGLSSFKNLRPSAAIRELIQNSLDAAIAANRPAEVCFLVEECPLSHLPGIQSYRSAFKQAKHAHEQQGLPDNAQAIIQQIERCLDGKRCSILYVLDNGIGLNPETMTSLLTDGQSNKQSDAAGSYGIGHSVVFPSSDLQYVLYGSISEGKRIASGHAILASHPGPRGKGHLSKDGYLCQAIRDNDFWNPYEFSAEKHIPKLLLDKIETIESRWGQGTVVAVTGFNNFKETYDNGNSLKEQVFRAASCNFFEAIHADRLVVEVAGSKKIVSKLNRHNLSATLSKYKDERYKRRNEHFVSGNKANLAFQTLVHGQKLVLPNLADAGGLEVMVRFPSSERTGFGLCRNGMWITDDVYMLVPGNFTQLMPFNCLLRLGSEGSFSRLVRKLEPPLHNELRQSELSKVDRATWKKVMETVAQRIAAMVPAQVTKTFKPDDILIVDTGGAGTGGQRSGRVGTPTAVRRRRPIAPAASEEDGEGPRMPGQAAGGTGRRRGRAFTRAGRTLPLRAVMLPTGKRRGKVLLVADAAAAGSEVRFTLDESIDVTSDSSSREGFVHLLADGIRVNGKQPTAAQFIKDDDDNALGLLLGNLEAGKEYQIDVEFSTNHLGITDDQAVVPKVEVVRRSARPDDLST